MVSGIPSVEAFVVGLVVGALLYFVKAPAMMFGLGVYLPFYMSAAAFLGAMLKVACRALSQRLSKADTPEERKAHEARAEQAGLVVASGIIGGESVVGVLVALFAIVSGMVAG